MKTYLPVGLNDIRRRLDPVTIEWERNNLEKKSSSCTCGNVHDHANMCKWSVQVYVLYLNG